MVGKLAEPPFLFSRSWPYINRHRSWFLFFFALPNEPFLTSSPLPPFYPETKEEPNFFLFPFFARFFLLPLPPTLDTPKEAAVSRQEGRRETRGGILKKLLSTSSSSSSSFISRRAFPPSISGVREKERRRLKQYIAPPPPDPSATLYIVPLPRGFRKGN